MLKLLITFSLFAVSICTYAQFSIVKKDTAAVTNQRVAKDILIEFEKAVQSNSLQPAFVQQRNSFHQKVNDSKDLNSLNKLKNDFIIHLKSAAFKNTTDYNELISSSNIAQTYHQFADQLKKAESILKTNAFTDIWVLQRSNWLTQLKKL